MKESNFNPQIIAFYLPQYHPIPENNENFGEGFTEWTNVAKAKPLFKGHIQPKIPADLGFYDLRLPEVRAKQAELAKEAGVTAFCYYHYWFGNGKVVMEKPLQEVVRLGEPDFPFCVCWANHTWYKKTWSTEKNKLEQELLFEQTYPGDQDIIDHFNYLLPTFKDRRYYKLDGRLVFVIYNLKDQPGEYWNRLKKIWNNLSKENGLPEFFFIANTLFTKDLDSELFNVCDMTILSLVTNCIMMQDFSIKNKIRYRLNLIWSRLLRRPPLVWSYKNAYPSFVDAKCKEENVIPVMVPNWDYTARRGVGGLIIKDSTPELFKEHVMQVFDLISKKDVSKQIVFLKSWNEWGEGNYMEPDLEFGKQYIKALKEVIKEYSNNNRG